MIGVTPPPAKTAFDPTDVPRVEAAQLAHLLDVMVSSGQGLIVLRGADAVAMKAMEAEFWRGHAGDTATGVAAIIRFRALIDVFASRRLASLLMREGFAVLRAAFRVAADIRLNTARGFNPQGLVWAVTAEMSAMQRRPRAGHGYASQIAA